MKREIKEVKPSKTATLIFSRQDVEQACMEWLANHGHQVHKPLAQSIGLVDRSSAVAGPDAFLVITQELDPYVKEEPAKKAA